MTGPRPPVTIVGLDLSLTSTGFALLSGEDWELGSIQPGKRAGHERLNYLLAQITERITGCDVAAIEGPSYGSVGGQSHERAGLWWLVAHELWDQDVPYVVIAPSQVKKYACGAGSGIKSGKDRVLAAVIRRYPQLVEGNDEADALVLAKMAADHYGQVTEAVPQVNRTALASVKNWPQLT
jgi:Holliday junction resolvasome RuvABC endonuclease subunit